MPMILIDMWPFTLRMRCSSALSMRCKLVEMLFVVTLQGVRRLYA